MHKNIKNILSAFVLLVVIFCSIIKVSNFLELKESDSRYLSYFRGNDNYDVIFIGSSHVRHGFFPMELWDNYGITSYNLAGNGNTIPISYWMLVNALDYHIPKVVVMDVYDMWPGRLFSESWGQVHTSLDAVPMSINKYRMVKDLFSDETLTDGSGNSIYNKRWELLWNLGEYHTRWSSLEKDDFATQKELEIKSRIWKGAAPLINVVKREETYYSLSSENLEYDMLSKKYLEKIIRICKQNDIELLLINTGYDCNEESKYFADSIYELANKYEITYIDFTQNNIINFNTDLHSTGHNTHVNFSGAIKFTNYIGKILQEKYLLEDHRDDENYEQWWFDLQSYENSKKDYLISQTNLLNYLLLLYDDNYKIIFEVKNKNLLLDNREMFINLGINVNYCSSNKNLITVNLADGKVEYFENRYISGSTWNTQIGELCLSVDTQGAYSMYLDGEKLYTLSSDTQPGINITVIRNTEIIDTRSF